MEKDNNNIQKNSFVFYRSYAEALMELDETERLVMFEAICEYALNGSVPYLNPREKALFCLIKPHLDANERKYKAKAEKKKRNEDCINLKISIVPEINH